jgi:hypothetical protein
MTAPKIDAADEVRDLIQIAVQDAMRTIPAAFQPMAGLWFVEEGFRAVVRACGTERAAMVAYRFGDDLATGGGRE